MANKLRGFPQAVGYWGRDPNQRMRCEQTPAKVRVGLQDMIRTNGRPVFLWQPVLATTAGVVACTCEKDTTQNSDVKCFSCYGMKLAPGYLRFLHETLFFVSAESASFTLTGTSLDVRKKPNRIQLSAGVASGTIVTQDKAFSNTTGQDWEVELLAFRKVAGDGITLESSTDAGVTWSPVALVVGPLGLGFRGVLTGLAKPQGTGTLRFRVTLTRASGASPESPSFEIVRARHVQPERVNPDLRLRSDYLDGQILILKTWETESVLREMTRGRVIEHEGDRMMTSPLDFFDVTLTMDTPPCALDDRGAGIHPFFEYSTGVRLAQRYAMTRISLDATFDGMLNQQSFSERRTQEGEVYAYVF